ncbi:MAG: division/cell wall cluster transcriptional repressor MraZ [Pseudomonadota bacterium]
MFRGITAINIDAKGRLVVPTRYRELLLTDLEANSFPIVVTIDTEAPCLLLYPMKVWEIIENKLQALSSFKPASRRIQRLLLGHATELEIDTNGRILLPPLLRDYAGLNKRVILVGQGKKFELWDEQRWNDNRELWLSQGLDENNQMPDELESLSL